MTPAKTPHLDRIAGPSDLGSSLGVVELAVAIHAVFDTPRDKLQDPDGPPRPDDDAPAGGRAFGVHQTRGECIWPVRRRSLQHIDLDAIAVIGDGSISAGMAYEAMNNAGAEGRRLFVILNDNEMSIAPPVGAMSKYMSSLYASPLGEVHKMAEGFEAALPGPLRDHARRARQLVTGATGGQGTL